MNTFSTLWAQVKYAFSNPMEMMSKLHSGLKASPIIVILTVVFVVEPGVTFVVDMYDDFVTARAVLNPSTRPVTEGELVLIDQKLDLLQTEVTALQPVEKSSNSADTYTQVQQHLYDVEAKLNANYVMKGKKSK